MEETRFISRHLRRQVTVQTPGNTTVRDIMLLQESELAKIKNIVAEMETKMVKRAEEEPKSTAQPGTKKQVT